MKAGRSHSAGMQPNRVALGQRTTHAVCARPQPLEQRTLCIVERSVCRQGSQRCELRVNSPARADYYYFGEGIDRGSSSSRTGASANSALNALTYSSEGKSVSDPGRPDRNADSGMPATLLSRFKNRSARVMSSPPPYFRSTFL